MTELWFRNPHNYVRELAEVGPMQGEPYRIAWDRGLLVKKRIDPIMHAKVYFGEHSDFEILCIGAQGSVHLNKEFPSMERPKAVYPTWKFGENFNILEEMVSSPIGEDLEACADVSIPPDERPVIGQEHRVIITNLPNATAGASRPFYKHLSELQEEYPECKIYLHGSYSYRVQFGMGFASADVECRTTAANGKVDMPNGKVLAYARTVNQLQWVNLMGMSVTDLKEPRMRCIFNIRSAMWAAEHFNENHKFKSQGQVEVDPDSPITVLPTTTRVSSLPVVSAQPGDKTVCDSCSLSDSCKYYREGAVCSLPGSTTSPLAKIFQSRSSDKIIDGLGTIVAAQVNRLEKGMEIEEEDDILDPEVSKMLNSVFKNGVTLAKLVDPTLTKPTVQVNGAAIVAGANPREMAAAVMRALELEGFSRDQVTPEMFENKMREMAGVPQQIEGKVVNG